MAKISYSRPPKAPQTGADIKPAREPAKAGHRKVVIHAPDKPAKTKFSLSALAKNIGKALMCRNVDTIDSISRRYLPESGQKIEDQSPPHSLTTAQRPTTDSGETLLQPGHSGTEKAGNEDLPVNNEQLPVDSISGQYPPEPGQTTEDQSPLHSLATAQRPATDLGETLDNDSEEDDTQDLIKELGDQLDSSDSGISSMNESDQDGSNKEQTTTSEQYNIFALSQKNVNLYPVRETLQQLKDLTDSIKIRSKTSLFLDECRTNPDWRDNSSDLNLGALRRLQSFISSSPLGLKEKNDLLDKMASTALNVLLHQLPKYNEKEAFEWLDVYEQILLSSNGAKNSELYDTGHRAISNHFAKQDPWHAQMRRLDNGQGSSIAFDNLVQHIDDHQKRLMTETFLQEKERKIDRLEEVVEQYDALNDDSMDELPLINNPRYVELLKLSREETSLRKRIGNWTKPMIRTARNTLNNA